MRPLVAVPGYSSDNPRCKSTDTANKQREKLQVQHSSSSPRCVEATVPDPCQTVCATTKLSPYTNSNTSDAVIKLMPREVLVNCTPAHVTPP